MGVIRVNGPLRVGMNGMFSESGDFQSCSSIRGGDGWSPNELQIVGVAKELLWDAWAK